jgi:demethoxyubiquinone hydroxylase (CLK1/Coq7/Cat5 family)
MRAGEPVAAVTWAFAAAEELHVVIEKFYIDQLFQLPNISAELAESLIDVTSSLRIYEAAA